MRFMNIGPCDPRAVADGAGDQARTPRALTRLVQGAQQQQGDEQDEDGEVGPLQLIDGVADPRGEMCVDEGDDLPVELREDAGHHAEEEDARAGGDRKAHQTGDDGDGERLEHQKGEVERVQVGLRREQDTRETGETAPQRPRQP